MQILKSSRFSKIVCVAGAAMAIGLAATAPAQAQTGGFGSNTSGTVPSTFTSSPRVSSTFNTVSFDQLPANVQSSIRALQGLLPSVSTISASEVRAAADRILAAFPDSPQRANFAADVEGLIADINSLNASIEAAGLGGNTVNLSELVAASEKANALRDQLSKLIASSLALGLTGDAAQQASILAAYEQFGPAISVLEQLIPALNSAVASAYASQ